MPRRPRGPLAARLARRFRPTPRRCAGAAALAAALGLPAAVCADAFTSYYGPTAFTTYTSSPYVAGFGAVGPSVTTARPFWDVFGVFERPVTARVAVPDGFAPPAAYARPASFAARPLFPRLAARRLAARSAYSAPATTSSYAPAYQASYAAPAYETAYFGAVGTAASVTNYSPTTSDYAGTPVPATSYYGGDACACPPDPCGGTLSGTTLGSANFGPTVVRGGMISGGTSYDGACPAGTTSYSFPSGVVPAGGTIIDGGMIEYGPAYAPPLSPTPDRDLPPARRDDRPRDDRPRDDGRTDRDRREDRDAPRRDDLDPRPTGDPYRAPDFDDDLGAPRDRGERSPGGGFGTGNDFPADPIPNDDFSAGDPGGGVVEEPDGGFYGNGDSSFGPDAGFGEAPDALGGGERPAPFIRPDSSGAGDAFDQEEFGDDPQGRTSRYRPDVPESDAPADDPAAPAVAPEPGAAPDADGGDADGENDGDAPASARGAGVPQLATADWLRRTFRRSPADRPPAPGPKVARGRFLPPGATAPPAPRLPGLDPDPSGADAARPRLVRN